MYLSYNLGSAPMLDDMSITHESHPVVTLGDTFLKASGHKLDINCNNHNMWETRFLGFYIKYISQPNNC